MTRAAAASNVRGFVYTVQCDDCASRTRVEVIGQATVVKRGSLFCPCCGGNNAVREYRTGDNEEEYFYILAGSMNLPQTLEGAALAKLIYNEWNPAEYVKFMDFYAAFQEEK